MARKQNFDFGGVRPGGLTEESDIRVLICFLLKNLETGLTRGQLDRIVLDDNRVSYFSYVSALESLVENRMLALEEETYAVTPAGREASGLLEDALPKSIRDAVLSKALAVLRRERVRSENSAEVRGSGKDAAAVCLCNDGPRQLMRLEVAAGNTDIARALVSGFMKQPEWVYRAAFGALTGDYEGLAALSEEIREEAQKEKDS